MRRLRWVGLVLLAAVGCGGGSKSGDEFGRVSGELRVVMSNTTTILSLVMPGRSPVRPPQPATETGQGILLLQTAPAPLTIPNEERILPGDVLVRFEDGTRDPVKAMERLRVSGCVGEHAGWASPEIHLVRYRRADGTPLDVDATRSLAAEVARLPGVRWTTLNRVHVPTAVPNDPLFPKQWHYATMNLPAAWDVNTQSIGVVVAVIDTGVGPHPDLEPQLVQGVDVVSDPRTSGDGDGRDMDPTDPGGDLSEGRSSWHGTHVSGTVGAASNNGLGVAGVSLNARVLPVRALGRNGGSTADVLAGITWAIGDDLPGLDHNQNPAQVINLSLGTVGPPDPAYQDLIDRAVGRGVVFVVAAGNESVATGDRIPCNQQNVICVGATRLNGTRASYSNFGAQVDVMAPGGQGLEDLNADDLPDAVLSTYFDEARTPAYAFLQGTSMATPHVSGLVALMKALDPGLNHARIEQILRETASPALACTEGCGAGLVNAQTALLRAAGRPGPSGAGALFMPASQLMLFEATTTRLLLINTGGAPLEVNASFSSAQAGLGMEFPEGPRVQLAPGEARTLAVNLTSSGLQPGDYEGTLTFAPTGAAAQVVPVRARIGSQGTAGNAMVTLLTRGSDGTFSVAAASPAFADQSYRYSIGVPPGLYYVAAGIDDNGNGELFEHGERAGFYPNSDAPVPVRVRAGETVRHIDFDLQPMD